MPMNFASLQIYNEYLTTYAPKGTSKFDAHKRDDLKSIYGSILQLNKLSPLSIIDTSLSSKQFALHLKEGARELRNTIASLGGLDEENLFSIKIAYSNHEKLATVEYLPEQASGDIAESLTLTIKSLASPQKNLGKALPSGQVANLTPGSYSFDVSINHLQYEFQFQVNELETNRELQDKLARLINRTNIGMNAKVTPRSDNRSSLDIMSGSSGLLLHDEWHFKISDAHTSCQSGVVDYLGLNSHIKNASNAVFDINGTTHSSYSNTFTIQNAYEITLHSADTKNPSANTVTVGLYPDLESLSHNIEAFVDGFNSFMNTAGGYQELSSSPSARLRQEMHRLLMQHEFEIQKYGIHINDDDTLSFSSSSLSAPVDPTALKSFGSHIIQKMNSISLNPMEYVNKKICAYKNPSKTYFTPYITSAYSGMLFSSYC